MRNAAMDDEYAVDDEERICEECGAGEFEECLGQCPGCGGCPVICECSSQDIQEARYAKAADARHQARLVPSDSLDGSGEG
jgi:predicted ATP-dependent serine protease